MAKDDLLTYYNQELAFIRQLGIEFAEAHPKIAGRLRLGPKSVEDPHVARLIEAFALLNAKTRHQLEDDFSQVRDALLENLYPHFQAPIPSMAVVQLQGAPDKLTSKKSFPAGTKLASSSYYGQACQFMTRYPVELWPIEVQQARLTGLPIQAPTIGLAAQAKASLRLSLSCSNNLTFAELLTDSLRFFINAPLQQAYAIYELLYRHTVAIAVADSHGDTAPLVLPKTCLRPVGFAEDEGMLPYSQRSFMGYRLLTEFFTLPEKFLFFELADLLRQAKPKLTSGSNTLEIYFYLDKSQLPLEQKINAQSFALGCTPIVNLFAQTAEPIQYDHTQTEYHLVPDAHLPIQATEVYSVQQVTAIDQHHQPQVYQPFYGISHDLAPGEAAYWYARRKPAWYANQYVIQGSEVFISLVEPGPEATTDVNSVAKKTLSVETLCTNRDLAGKLPSGGAEPYLALVEIDELVSKISCLTPFTPSFRPNFTDKLGWQLISHLSLNHLSLTEGEQSLAALKEILRLYDFTGSDENRNLLDGMIGLSCRQVTARNPGVHGTMLWQGMEIKLQVDESYFSATSLYLFGTVLERFLALYTTINSFTQLVVTNSHNKELYRWMPRIGAKQLI